MDDSNGPTDPSELQPDGATRESVKRGAPTDRRGEWAEADDSVSAAGSEAQLVSRFDHQGCACELGLDDERLYGFVRAPADVDRLNLLWELNPPGAFTYGPDDEGWVGFEAPEGRGPREVGVALAGLAAQVADRGRVAPD